MSMRMWVSVLAVACLVIIGVKAGGGVLHVRSEHSRPAVRMVTPNVIVTDNGKLYHRPDCPFMHGKGHTVSLEEAEHDGYTPCTRCMKDALVSQ